MRRRLGWVAIGWLLLLCALALVVYGRPTAGASLRERTLAIAGQLRCPVCQGESVADSESGIAQGMRDIIRRRLQQGQSSAQIETYFVSRYGEKVLLSPPSSGVGGIAWLAPPLLVLGGAGLLVTLVVDWRGRTRVPASPVNERYLARVRRELHDDGV
jgi:cytochrome c-type biogenesis protein CcmH